VISQQHPALAAPGRAANPDERAVPSISDAPLEIDQLTRLLFGASRDELLASWAHPSREHLLAQQADLLGEAVNEAAGDTRFTTAIAPVIASGVLDTARRQPDTIGEAIAPALGPGIRSMIKTALEGMNQRIETSVQQLFTVQGLKWRWESYRTGVQVSELVLRDTLSYRVEHVLLIHRASGTLLKDAMQPDCRGKDPAVLASMLTAVADFISDAFSASDAVAQRQFAIGDMTVRVLSVGDLVLAAVIRGEAPQSVTEKLQRCLESCSLIAGESAQRFCGDLSAFAPLVPFLDECLVSQNIKDRRGGSLNGVSPVRRWLGPLLLFAATALTAWLWIDYRQSKAWTEFLSQLESHPGFVLLEHERVNRFGRPQYAVTGLLDEHADAPQKLATDAGHRISWRLHSFISGDPVMLARRAGQRLNAHGDTLLEVFGSTLHVAGWATREWVEKAQTTPVAGIVAVNTDRVRLIQQHFEHVDGATCTDC
jgi:OOP family OmpA-OmpF porin